LNHVIRDRYHTLSDSDKGMVINKIMESLVYVFDSSFKSVNHDIKLMKFLDAAAFEDRLAKNLIESTPPWHPNEYIFNKVKKFQEITPNLNDLFALLESRFLNNQINDTLSNKNNPRI